VRGLNSHKIALFLIHLTTIATNVFEALEVLKVHNQAATPGAPAEGVAADAGQQ